MQSLACCSSFITWKHPLSRVDDLLKACTYRWLPSQEKRENKFHIHLLHILYFQTYVCNRSQWSAVFPDYGQCISGSCPSGEETEEAVFAGCLEVIGTAFLFASLVHAYWC